MDIRRPPPRAGAAAAPRSGRPDRPARGGPRPVRRVRGDAQQPPGGLGVGEQVGGGPRCAVRPSASTTQCAARRRTTARFCSTSRTGTASAARSSTWATSVTTLGASPLVGSSAMISRLPFSRVRAMATICCWPPDRVPANCRARCRSSGKSSCTRRTRARRPPRPLGQPQVLGDGQRRRRPRGPRARSRCRGAPACGWAAARSPRRRAARCRCAGPGRGRRAPWWSCPAPLRPSSAVTPEAARRPGPRRAGCAGRR